MSTSTTAASAFTPEDTVLYHRIYRTLLWSEAEVAGADPGILEGGGQGSKKVGPL